MRRDQIEDIEVEKCPACQGIFFRRGELEEVLLRHDAHRRGFFRQLLGFHRDGSRDPRQRPFPIAATCSK